MGYDHSRRKIRGASISLRSRPSRDSDKIPRCIHLPFKIRVSGHCLNWPKSSLGQRMMMFRTLPEVPAYLMWALNSDAIYQQVVLFTGGATSPHINIGDI